MLNGQNVVIGEELYKDIVSFFGNAKENAIYDIIPDDKNEKLFVECLNCINQKYHCMTHEVIPYANQEKNCYANIKNNVMAFVETDISVELKYKIFDFMWLQFKEYACATKALKGFTELISASNDYRKNCVWFNRCLSIYLSIQKDEISFDFHKALMKMIDLGRTETVYSAYTFLNIAFEKELLLTVQLLSPVEEKMKQFETVSNSELFVEFSLLYEKLLFSKENIPHTGKPCTLKKVSNARRKVADLYIERAKNETDNIFRRVENTKSAIETLKGIKSTEEERIALQRMLAKLQKESSQSMCSIKATMDRSQVIQNHNKNLDCLTGEESFYYFLMSVEISSYDKIKSELFGSEKPMTWGLFQQRINDKNGKLLAILPSLNGKIDGGDEKQIVPHVEHHSSVIYSNYVNLCMTFLLSAIKEKKAPILEEVVKLIETSAFVPQDRKRAYKKGLLAGFDCDYITAINILAPQIENSVRQLAFECGDGVTKINDDGTEEYLSLNSLLSLPHLNDSVDKKLLFNLKIVFASKYGFDLRNRVAHGVLDDEDFSNTHCFFAWWFVLRICLEFSPLKQEFFEKMQCAFLKCETNDSDVEQTKS